MFLGVIGGLVDVCVMLFLFIVMIVIWIFGLVRCFLGLELEVMEEIIVVYVFLGLVWLVVGCFLVDMDILFWLEVVFMIFLFLVVDGGMVDGGVVGVGVVDIDILFWLIVVFLLLVLFVVVKGVVLIFFVKKWVCFIVLNVCIIFFGNGLIV